jgi:hypothetical protein
MIGRLLGLAARAPRRFAVAALAAAAIAVSAGAAAPARADTSVLRQ